MIGSIKKQSEWETWKNTITGVGLNKSSITF
jgi:hypothetical protein